MCDCSITLYNDWLMYDGTTFVAANNIIVRSNMRILIYIPGGNGTISEPPVESGYYGNMSAFLQLIASCNQYHLILALTYDASTNGIISSAKSVADRLQQLTKLYHLHVDIAAYSEGTLLTRYAMEYADLGVYPIFNNVILVASFNEGINFGNPLSFPESYPSTTSQHRIQKLRVINSILIGADIVALGEKNLTTYLQHYGSTLANIELDVKYGNDTSSLFELCNLTQVHTDVYNTLRYITINAGPYNLESYNNVAYLSQVLGVEDVYAELAVIGGTDDALSLKLANEYSQRYPSLGLLLAYAVQIAPISQRPVTTDGIIAVRNEVLNTKSKYYAENNYEANYNIPVNHANVFSIQDPNMYSFWKRFITGLEVR